LVSPLSSVFNIKKNKKIKKKKKLKIKINKYINK